MSGANLRGDESVSKHRLIILMAGIVSCSDRYLQQSKRTKRMTPGISHDRKEETPEAKARWFQSLSLAERMDYLCFMNDLVLENNSKAMKIKNAQPNTRRICILSKA